MRKFYSCVSELGAFWEKRRIYPNNSRNTNHNHISQTGTDDYNFKLSMNIRRATKSKERSGGLPCRFLKIKKSALILG